MDEVSVVTVHLETFWSQQKIVQFTTGMDYRKSFFFNDTPVKLGSSIFPTHTMEELM